MPTTNSTITGHKKDSAAPRKAAVVTARQMTTTAPRQTVRASVAIVGGSGYTGALLAELLLRHPSVQLTHLSSESLPANPSRPTCLGCAPTSASAPRARSAEVDVAFVCTPHGEAAPVVKRLLDTGAQVVDLSADFRLDAATYAEWYGEHPYP